MQFDDGDKTETFELTQADLRHNSDKRRQLRRFSRSGYHLKLKLEGIDADTLMYVMQEILGDLDNLTVLDLSSNHLTREEFFTFMKAFKHDGVREIIFRDNLVECHDELTWNNDFTFTYPNLPKLTRVDLSGNAICDHGDRLIMFAYGCDRATYENALSLLLEVTGFSFEEFSDCSYEGLPPKKDEDMYDKYTLQLLLHDKIHKFDLTENDRAVLDEVRKGYQMPDIGHAFQVLQLAIRKAEAECEDFNFRLRYKKLSPAEKIKLMQVMFNYHPDASLSGLLHRHPLYHTETIDTCQSLLFKAPLSVEQGYVYFLTHKEGLHSELAFECMTPDGQRVFERAHLTAIKADGLMGSLGKKVIIIEYKQRPLLEQQSDILENYKIARLPATYEQCQSLWNAIDEETVAGVASVRYSSSFSLSSSGSSEEKEAEKIRINCVTWAVNKIRDHVGPDLSVYSDPKANTPLPSVEYMLMHKSLRPGVNQSFVPPEKMKIVIEKNHPMFLLGNSHQPVLQPGRNGLFNINTNHQGTGGNVKSFENRL